jgi:hypothetical protein
MCCSALMFIAEMNEPAAHFRARRHKQPRHRSIADRSIDINPQRIRRQVCT